MDAIGWSRGKVRVAGGGGRGRWCSAGCGDLIRPFTTSLSFHPPDLSTHPFPTPPLQAYDPYLGVCWILFFIIAPMPPLLASKFQFLAKDLIFEPIIANASSVRFLIRTMPSVASMLAAQQRACWMGSSEHAGWAAWRACWMGSMASSAVSHRPSASLPLPNQTMCSSGS